MISAVNGVLLSPEEAQYIVGAFDEFVQILGEQSPHAGLSPRLAHAVEQLRVMSRKCVDSNENSLQERDKPGSSQADEPNTLHAVEHVTVSTTDAARILGVKPSAVRAMAKRTPERLGSHHVGGHWRHQLDRVEQRATHKHRRRYTVFVSTPEPGVTKCRSSHRN